MAIASFIDKFGQQLPVFLVIQARISALFASLFFFRRDLVPVRIVVTMTTLLSLYIMGLGGGPHLTSVDQSVTLFPTLIMQIFLGLLTGLIINFFVEIFLGFGQVVSMQSGLGMAQMYVAKLGTISPLTQFFVLTATMIFFQLNGHLVAVKLIVNSFTSGPSVTHALDLSTLKEILDFSSLIFRGAMMLSLSVVIAVMLSNFTIGIMSKFAPQINIFSVGINISLIICFFAAYVSFDLIVENGNVLLNEVLDFVKQTIP